MQGGTLRQTQEFKYMGPIDQSHPFIDGIKILSPKALSFYT